MPGIKDRDHPLASYMTPYVENRTGISAADAIGTPAVPTINLSSPATYDAVNNLIYVTAVRTAGDSGAIVVELWQNNPRSSLDTLWRKMATATLDHLGEARFDAIYAADYRLRVDTVPAETTWSLHESHSAYQA